MAAPPDDPDRTAERPAGSSPDDPAERFPFLSPPDPAHPGDLGRLGPYRVARLLGEGGMGFVFRGEDDALGRPVALKVMRPEVAAQPTARDRFLREGRAAAAVKSDHVVTIYQVDKANGVPFLAMEYLDGQTLADWLKDWREANPVPARPEMILAVARDLLRGLVAAHAKGLIHRDIKPPNLWIESGTNRLKLLDFGLVRDGPSRDLTLSGVILGTAAYMAPEQARCKAVDARTDLFGVGVVLHELLAGQSPFRRDNYNETLIAVLVEPAPPASSFGKLPPGLAALIDRLLEKSPEARPATAAEVLAEVTRIEQALRPVSVPRREALVVCARGTGTHRTIGEAIRAASPGAEIRIRPGVYWEGVVLDRHVVLVGDGPVEQIVIESADANCLLMKTDRATVTGLTLRCTAGAAGKKFYAVDIPRGELLLTGCAVTSDSLACIGIHGKEANPTVRDCRIHDGKAAGVFVYEQGRGTVEGCDISANANSGVEIKAGGDPTVRDCRIHDGCSAGVLVHTQGRGMVEGCDISANANSGVEVRDGGDPTVRDCRIHDGKAGGVFVYEQGRGTVEGCDISANAKAGVEIKTGGDPTVRDCRIHDGCSAGVLVHTQGRGTVEGCDISANAQAGVTIQEGGDPTVRDCRITTNAYEGIWVLKGGRGTIEGCRLSGNQRGAWDIEDGCEVVRRRNTE